MSGDPIDTSPLTDAQSRLARSIEEILERAMPATATGEDLDRAAGLAAIERGAAFHTAIAEGLARGDVQLAALRDEAADLGVFLDTPYFYPATPAQIQSDLLAMVASVAADASLQPVPNTILLSASEYRQAAKAANFGIPRGMGAGKLLSFGDAAQEYVEIAITREEFLDRVRRVGEHEWVGASVAGKRHNRHDRRRAFLRRDPLVQIAADAIECGRRAVAIGVLAECVALERAIALTTPRRQLAWVTPTHVDKAIDAGITPVRQYSTPAEVAEDFDAWSSEYIEAMRAFGHHDAPNCRCYVAPRYELPAGHALRFLSRWAGTRAFVESQR